MTNTSAIVIFCTVIFALIGDSALNDGEGTLFLLKKLDDLREWLAFWR